MDKLPALPAHPEHPWIDCSEAPLYRWTFPPTTSDADLVACFDARLRWAETFDDRCAWLVDLRALEVPSASQRALFARHLEAFEPFDVRCNQGSALVVPNGVVAGVVTAIFWIAPPKFPNRSFTDIERAREWAQSQLGPRSIPPPAF